MGKSRMHRGRLSLVRWQARWHLGQMRRDDQWQAVEQIERQVADDEQLKEYRSLRDAASGNARRQL